MSLELDALFDDLERAVTIDDDPRRAQADEKVIKALFAELEERADKAEVARKAERAGRQRAEAEAERLRQSLVVADDAANVLSDEAERLRLATQPGVYEELSEYQHEVERLRGDNDYLTRHLDATSREAERLRRLADQRLQHIRSESSRLAQIDAARDKAEAALLRHHRLQTREAEAANSCSLCVEYEPTREDEAAMWERAAQEEQA